MIIDCHCHAGALCPEVSRIDREKDGTTLPERKQRIAFVNAVTPDNWEPIARLAETPGTYPFYGIHPWHCQSLLTDQVSDLEAWLTAHPSAGVGEIGLDKTAITKYGCPMDHQRSIFLAQLTLAQQLNRPVSIHCVRAWDILFDCLAQIQTGQTALPRFMIHGYSGSITLANRLIKTNAWLSFKITELDRLKHVIHALPLDRILLETDSDRPVPDDCLLFACAALAQIRHTKARVMIQQLHFNAMTFLCGSYQG